MITKRSREIYLKRKRRVRKNINGTGERPRLSVFRSARHIYAQVINDETGQTLVSASSVDKELRNSLQGKNKTDVAALVGGLVADRCLANNIAKVVFDRNGFIYHGRIARLADSLREKGLLEGKPKMQSESDSKPKQKKGKKK